MGCGVTTPASDQMVAARCGQGTLWRSGSWCELISQSVQVRYQKNYMGTRTGALTDEFQDSTFGRPLQCSSLCTPLAAAYLEQRTLQVLQMRPGLDSFPKQFTVGFSLRKKRLAAVCSGRVPGACPPCVRHVSASCLPCVHLQSAMVASPNFVCHVSTMRPPCVRPCVHFGRASKPCLPSVRLAFCPPCVGHVSAMCPPCVRLCPP